MQRNIRWIGLYTAMLCVAGYGPARADITAVLPVEGGTVGTLMTLMGSGFGDKRGKVQLGREECRILSWGDTIVTCEVATPQPAGSYTVTLSPQGDNRGHKKGPEKMTFSSFTMRAPQITPGEPLRLVKPRERVTIAGAFFGDKKGEVYLVDTPGHTRPAKVRHWSMNSISFEIPEGLVGNLILEVANEVGSDVRWFWGTFTPPLPGATQQVDYELAKANNNASGVYFNGDLWVFYPDKNDDIQVTRYRDGSFVSAPQCGGSTYAQVVPLVIDHELWAFCTGRDKGLCYKKFLTSSNQWQNGHGSWNRIGNLTAADSGKEIAPVYNPLTKRIELYYWNSNETISWIYSSDQGINWSSARVLAGVANVKTAPGAVYWQQTTNSGVTLLSVGAYNPTVSKTFAKVYYLQSGVVLSNTVADNAWGILGRPSLADLGEDYMALVWEDPSEYHDYHMRKMDKRTGVWYGITYAYGLGTWSPSVAVNYEAKSDTNSLSNRWDAVLYVFWQGLPHLLGHYYAEMASVETLGSWREVTTPYVVNLETTDYLHLWPVVGVVDAPPFVQNGENYTDDPPDPLKATRVEFRGEYSTNAGFSYEMKCGTYFETGEESPLKMELSTSLSEAYETGSKKTVKFTDTLFRSKEGAVMVYYLVPRMVNHTVQWIPAGSTTATTNCIQVMQTTGLSLWNDIFPPTEFPFGAEASPPGPYFDTNRFVQHQEENDRQRLATYTPPSTTYTNWFFAGKNWPGSDASIEFASSTEETHQVGFEIEWKVGAQYKKLFGMGMEGSFRMQMTSSVTLDLSTALYMVNPVGNGDIFNFRTDCYWLAPSAQGTWVPQSRQEYGDQPWFITYAVTYVNP